MDLVGIASGVLSVVSIFYPQAAPIVGILQKVLPHTAEIGAAVKIAVDSGQSAFKKIQEEAPELSEMVRDLVKRASQALSHDPEASEVREENLARMIFGYDRMTPEEELKWMNDMTPGNDPSQENSKYSRG